MWALGIKTCPLEEQLLQIPEPSLQLPDHLVYRASLVLLLVWCCPRSLYMPDKFLPLSYTALAAFNNALLCSI